MLAQYLDLTQQFIDQDGFVTIDVSNYDYCLIQSIGADVTLESTIDSGAIQGVSDGSAVSATNFTQVVGIKLNNGTTFTNTVENGNIVRLEVIGRYVKISGISIPSKLLVMLAKIS
jgi:hypothetical protein